MKFDVLHTPSQRHLLNCAWSSGLLISLRCALCTAIFTSPLQLTPPPVADHQTAPLADQTRAQHDHHSLQSAGGRSAYGTKVHSIGRNSGMCALHVALPCCFILSSCAVLWRVQRQECAPILAVPHLAQTQRFQFSLDSTVANSAAAEPAEMIDIWRCLASVNHANTGGLARPTAGLGRSCA